MRFLLTRPLRDVTGIALSFGRYSRFLLTRPLRDVTEVEPNQTEGLVISTHTPLAGRDTHIFIRIIYNVWISTHTPLAGRDWMAVLT